MMSLTGLTVRKDKNKWRKRPGMAHLKKPTLA